MKKNANNKTGNIKSRPAAVSAHKSIFAAPYQLFYFLIPLAALFLFGGILMGMSETLPVVIWFITLMLIGLTAFPISAYLFKNSGSAGFFMAQPMGLILAGLIVWTLSYLKIFRFNLLCVILALLILCGISYGVRPFRKNLINVLGKENVIPRAVTEQTIFAVVFVLLCYFKGFSPSINGQEKFMDYGFIMSMLRNPSLPANDMWLSGYSINYYYYGQYLYAFLIKLSGVKTGIGYNLAMCSAIAIPFTMAYSVGCMLIDSAASFGLRCNGIMTHISGILTGFCVMIFGNSHSFFYDEDSVGHSLLKLFDKMGFKVGNYLSVDPEYKFFYPDSTRYIGYNPDSATFAKGGGDYTIEEFPFYSYLVGDLHAHVVSTMIVLLIMAICIALVTRNVTMAEHPSSFNTWINKTRMKAELSNIITPELVAIAILLGCAQMTNYWDFLIYFVFSSMTLLVLYTRQSRDFSSILGCIFFFISVGLILGAYLYAGSSPLLHFFLQLLVLIVSYLLLQGAPCALTRTGTAMSFIFAGSTLVALPFNYNFEMISNSLGKAKNHTDPYQLFILWGTHAIICICFFILTMAHRNYAYRTISKKRKNNKRNSDSEVIGSEAANPIANFLAQRNIVDFFVCGMIAVGFLLIIAPEIFYVRDIYTGGYLRANTMFKFCYAAFIILSVCVAYIVIRLFWFVSRKGEYSNGAYACAIAFCLMLLVPAHYTYLALDQRSDFKNNEFITLDGTAYLDTYYSPNNSLQPDYGNMLSYDHAIDWFNSEVEGSHVILEACGDSYTDYNIISAYTGLPTVRGWFVHEWLWRFHGIVDKENDILINDPDHSVWDILDPRTEAVRTVYTLGYDAEQAEYRADEIAWELANNEFARLSEDPEYEGDIPMPDELHDQYLEQAYSSAVNEQLDNIRSLLVQYEIDYVIDPDSIESINGAIRAIDQHILDYYDVEYVIIGDLEAVYYGTINSTMLESLGDVVFEDGSLKIIKLAADQ